VDRSLPVNSKEGSNPEQMGVESQALVLTSVGIMQASNFLAN